MTLEAILSGPAVDRANFSAHPMTEAEARGILLKAERQMSRKQRGLVFRKFADAKVGNLSEEARALYRAYAAVYGA